MPLSEGEPGSVPIRALYGGACTSTKQQGHYICERAGDGTMRIEITAHHSWNAGVDPPLIMGGGAFSLHHVQRTAVQSRTTFCLAGGTWQAYGPPGKDRWGRRDHVAAAPPPGAQHCYTFGPHTIESLTIGDRFFSGNPPTMCEGVRFC